MDRHERLVKQLVVEPGSAAGLARRDTGWAGDQEFAGLSSKKLSKEAKERLAEGVQELSTAQELLWASDSHSLLVVFQAMDAAGKDSTIKHVMSGVNPQGRARDVVQGADVGRARPRLLVEGGEGCSEPRRDRHLQPLALRGGRRRARAPRVAGDAAPASWHRGKRFWAERYESINNFERHLARNGTTIIKFFLHVSKAEQKHRFMARLDRPEKNWKFSAADVTERAHWDAYMEAYEDAITATSTKWAPWYVLPADHKPMMQAMAAAIIAHTIAGLDLKWPTVSDADRERNAKARAALEAEDD
jgi:polyphosphate kinase 2 (PPK2 family)